jgi:acyl-CoA hydrolase
MHIGIDVRAGDPTTTDRELTTHCIVIMVAVDGAGTPVQVPEWVPVSDKDKLLRDSAITLMEMRKKIGAEMEAHLKP